MYAEKNLVNLKGLQEEWAIADRKGGFIWGLMEFLPILTIKKNYPTYNMRACKGSPLMQQERLLLDVINQSVFQETVKDLKLSKRM